MSVWGLCTTFQQLGAPPSFPQMVHEKETPPQSTHSIPLQRREHLRMPSSSDTLGIPGKGCGGMQVLTPPQQLLPLVEEEGDSQVFGSSNNINILINPFQQHGTS